MHQGVRAHFLAQRVAALDGDVDALDLGDRNRVDELRAWDRPRTKALVQPLLDPSGERLHGIERGI